MTREPDAIHALRSYARDIERSVDPHSVAPVDGPRQGGVRTHATDPFALRITSLFVSSAALAALVIAIVLVQTADPDTTTAAPTSTVTIEASTPQQGVNAVRAVARLRSVGLTEAAGVVERASRLGITEVEPGSSLLGSLMRAVETWVIAPIGDLASDPVVVAAIDGLTRLSAPPGLDPGFVPPGQDGGSLPPGQDPDFVPPGQDPDFVPPGQDPDFVPPGQDPDFVPPGQDPDFVPPGQDPDFVPPGQDGGSPPGEDPATDPPGRGQPPDDRGQAGSS